MTTYVHPNFPSKSAFKKHIAEGKEVSFESQSIIERKDFSNFSGKILDVMGPHFPKPHSWYANVILENGKVKKVL
jgi:hypothetical protein